MKPRAALIILDGFGYREESHGNAIAQAKMKTFDNLWETYPHTTLACAGLDAGLPDGQMGNSEVGHLNIGAGRVVYQTYTRIDRAIEDKSFFDNPALVDAVQHAKKNQSALHLIGLLSDGGVHSHIRHFYSLLEMAKKNDIKEVYIHACLDGRDVPPSSALEYVNKLEAFCTEKNIGEIASISGRYYAMDRDNRWERVEKAYSAMVEGKGESASSAVKAVQNAYDRGETDEFVLPTVITNDKNESHTIKDKDSVIFINFRPDRAREISQALGLNEFEGFQRKQKPDILYTTMAEYDHSFPFPVAFGPEKMKNILSEVLANNGLTQLRVAETEKYAHVTFFFNGLIETPFSGEERVLIPSPQVATYDEKPEMSALEVTNALLENIDKQKHDVIIVNYANPDMVGHTGDIKATVKALETIDQCLEKVIEKFNKLGVPVLITADHGNADEMIDQAGNTVTAHTTNRVPCLLISPDNNNKKLRNGGQLADIAPTLLDILNIEKPSEMTGKTLIEEN